MARLLLARSSPGDDAPVVRRFFVVLFPLPLMHWLHVLRPVCSSVVGCFSRVPPPRVPGLAFCYMLRAACYAVLVRHPPRTVLPVAPPHVLCLAQMSAV